MSNIMKRFRVLALGFAVIGVCPIVEAQRQQDGQFNQNNNQQNFQGGGRRGRQNQNNFGNNENFNQRNFNQNQNFQEFNQRNNRRNFGNNANVQVADADYGIIASKSIFMRDRRDRNQQTGPQYVDPRTLPPEELLVVTGIVFEDGGFHAFVEHLLDSGQRRVVVGNEIADGIVEEIGLDSIKYRKKDAAESVSVPVSNNLMGRRVDSIQGERLRLQTMTGGGGGGGGNTEQFNRGNQLGGGGNFNNPGGNFTGGNFNNNGGNFGNRGRGGGNTIVTVPPPPLVGDSSMSLEERMRMRRQQEGQPGAQPAFVPPPPQQQNADDDDDRPAAAAQEAPADGLSAEERMRLRRAQELGQ